jgi:hypothetical protein
MSYLSTTDTVTLTSDTPAILIIVPETWRVRRRRLVGCRAAFGNNGCALPYRA